MIGAIAGDIIGSPYVNFPRGDSADIFFDIFSSATKIDMDGERARARTYEAKPSVLSDLVKAAAAWMLSSDPTAERWEETVETFLGERRPTATEMLAVCGPIVSLSGSTDEAVRYASLAVNALKPGGEALQNAIVFTRVLGEMKASKGNGDAMQRMEAVLAAAGFDVTRNASEIRPFILGNVRQGERPGTLTMGDGKTVRDASEVIPAAWAAVRESGSFEEAVRRGTAVGGDSALVACLAGTIAEQRWDVPQTITYRAAEFLSQNDRELVNRYDRRIRQMAEGETAREAREEDMGRFSVIRMEGMGSIYVVPEERMDIEAAIEEQNRSLGRDKDDYRIIRPDEVDGWMERLREQKSLDGELLYGTYIEHARPEVKPLWLQDGEIRTAYIRKGVGENGKKLDSVDKRRKVFGDFKDLQAYAEKARTALEDKAGWNPAKGKGLLDENAYLKEVYLPGVLGKAYSDALKRVFDAKVALEALPGCYPAEDAKRLTKEAYTRYLVEKHYGDDYGKVVDSRADRMLDALKGGLHSEYVEGLQKEIAELEGKTDADSRKLLDVKKADLHKAMTFDVDLDSFFEGLCMDKYGRSLTEFSKDYVKYSEQLARDSVSGTLDEQFDQYRKDVTARKAEYTKASKELDKLSGKHSVESEGFREQYDAYVSRMQGRHLHFARAFYPVVTDHSVEIREGDLLRARVFIDDDGRFQVDHNTLDGGFGREGIESVMATMRLLPKHPSMEDVKTAIDMYVLDESRILTDEERKMLADGDEGKVYEEAGAIRKLYASNVERAQNDMSTTLPEAAVPDGPSLSVKAVQAQEKRREESAKRYEGMEAVSVARDSQAHQGSVFTIGHSNLKEEEFDSLLKRHGIEVLVDVRSVTYSKYNKQFNQETLDNHLYDNGVEYYHFPSFGGMQYEGSGKDSRQLSYEEIMAKPEFKTDMKRLLDCVKDGNRVALMCSEGDPMDCHRMVMMGRALAHPEVYGSEAQPVDVQHITRTGYVLSQDYFEKKLVENYGPYIKADSGTQILNDAYRMRGEALLKGNGEKTSVVRNGMKQKAAQQKAKAGQFRRWNSKKGGKGI